MAASKGSSVEQITFKAWQKDEILWFKTEEKNNKKYVIRCLVCARNKDIISAHPACHGPAKKAMLSYIQGTNFVKKHNVIRHLEGKAHSIALEVEAGKDKDEQMPMFSDICVGKVINHCLS